MAVTWKVNYNDTQLCARPLHHVNAESTFIQDNRADIIECTPCLLPTALGIGSSVCFGDPITGHRPWNYQVEIVGGGPYPGDMMKDGQSKWNLPFYFYPPFTPDNAAQTVYHLNTGTNKGILSIFCNNVTPCDWVCYLSRYSFTGGGGSTFMCVWEARPEAAEYDSSVCPGFNLYQGIVLPMYTSSRFSTMLNLGNPKAYPKGAGWPPSFDDCNSVGTGTGDSQFGVRITWDFIAP